MKNFYHYVMAMLYLQIAHRQPGILSPKWLYWITKSMKHANAILRSLETK